MCFAVLYFTKTSITNYFYGCSNVRFKCKLQVYVILNVLLEPFNYLRMGIYSKFIFQVFYLTNLINKKTKSSLGLTAANYFDL